MIHPSPKLRNDYVIYPTLYWSMLGFVHCAGIIVHCKMIGNSFILWPRAIMYLGYRHVCLPVLGRGHIIFNVIRGRGMCPMESRPQSARRKPSFLMGQSISTLPPGMRVPRHPLLFTMPQDSGVEDRPDHSECCYEGMKEKYSTEDWACYVILFLGLLFNHICLQTMTWQVSFLVISFDISHFSWCCWLESQSCKWLLSGTSPL